MNKITIKQACETDIPIVENILLDTVNWLIEMGQPLWEASEVTWERLSGNPQTGDHYISGNYKISDFYIAYSDGRPAGCMVLIDNDPFFWPDVKKRESLFIHKLAVIKAARKSGISDALINFSKEQAAIRGINAVRLDTDASRPKTRVFYERHGFTFVKTKNMGPFSVAFYVCNLPDIVKTSFVYGTGNPAKLHSMRDCLAPLYIRIIGLNEININITVPDVEENGKSPLENARIKALAYYTVLRKPVFACDSGLYIDGLADSEQPGVHVRTVNGKRLNDDEMIAYYAAIAGKLGGKATARYKNAICLVMNENIIYEHFGDDISGEVFCLTDKPHPKRTEGFPLDCLSVHIESGKYYYWQDKGSVAGMMFNGFQDFFRKVITQNADSFQRETDEERQARIYPIILSEYNPEWPKWFAEEKVNLENIIGLENIFKINHYGSTSVPGLTAKPTVDILLEINEDADVERLITAMSLPEYICLKGNGLTISTPPPHLVFIKGYLSDGFAEKVFHIHVVYPGNHNELLFRDYLITHPETALEYAELKCRLFKSYEYDRDGYTEAKGEFIRSVVGKAKEKKNAEGTMYSSDL